MATEGKKMADAIVNPKRNLARQEEEAENGPPADDGRAGRDAGNLPGNFQMTQSKFSGYPDGTRKRGGPPAELLKKHDKE